MKEYTCEQCGKKYMRYPSRQKRGKRCFCTHACYLAAPKSAETRAKTSTALKGKKRGPVSKETRQKMSESARNRGRTWWKGDSVGYGALHVWIKRHFVDPGVCHYCKRPNLALQWASRHDRPMNREQENWYRLCVKCHNHYDRCERAPYCAWCGEHGIPKLHQNHTPEGEMSRRGRLGAEQRWEKS